MDLVRVAGGATSEELAPVGRRAGPDAQAFATRAWSDNTRRGYRAAWSRFRAWCEARGERLLPASEAALSDYLAHMAKSGRRPGTMNVALSAITHAHRLAEVTSPTKGAQVQMVLKGIRNTVGVAPVQKAPLVSRDMREITDTLPRDLGGCRDRAVLLLTFSGAFRRSEVVALDVDDLRFVETGIEVSVKRSKTDQSAKGFVKVISFGTKPSSCPVRAVRAWIEAAHIVDGPLFRQVDRHGRVGVARLRPRAVARVVKRSVKAIGNDPRDFGAHSLRAGMITTAIKNGVSLARVMAVSGHKSVGVLVSYDRLAHRWDDPATAHLGL